MARQQSGNFVAPADPAAQPDPAASTDGEQSSVSSDIKELVTKLMGEVESLRKDSDAKSRKIANLDKALAEGPKPKKEAEETTLTAQVRAMQEQLAKGRKGIAKSAIASALASEGVDSDRVGKAAAYLLHEFGDKVQVTDDNDVVVDDNGTLTDATAYVKAYMQMDGKWLLPARKPPADKASARSGATGARQIPHGKTLLTHADYLVGKFDLKTMKAGGYEYEGPPDIAALLNPVG